VVGNREMEPLANFGHAGSTTRFPQAYTPQSVTGSPVLKAFTYGNVAVIRLDGNHRSFSNSCLVSRAAGSARVRRESGAA
jgi:hypothetical protein